MLLFHRNSRWYPEINVNQEYGETMLKILATILITAAIQVDANWGASPRYQAPCTPEPGWSWCMAPNRDAAIRNLPSETKRILVNGQKELLTNLATHIRDFGKAKHDAYITKEGDALLKAVRRTDGESLFLSLVPREFKPNIDFRKDGILSHNFVSDLSKSAAGRNPFVSPKLLKALERLNVYCHGPELLLNTNKNGTPDAKYPVQTDLNGCTED